jgi:hypothetical protein
MSYSATMVLPCKCGAECHVIMECDDDAKDFHKVSVSCWKCQGRIGQVAALSAKTRATAREAIQDWLSEHPPVQ